MKITKPKNRRAYKKTDYCNELGGQIENHTGGI